MSRKATRRAVSAGKEGAGNRTAARRSNEAQQGFTQKGQVAQKAGEAERPPDSPERRLLARAEAVGKRHKAAADPDATGK